jgi:hypothetical protein
LRVNDKVRKRIKERIPYKAGKICSKYNGGK